MSATREREVEEAEDPDRGGAPAGTIEERLAFDQADFTGARTLGRFLLREFDPLAFTEQLEHRPSHR